MVSQMAHAKNLGEPFMAHLENLYNIPCYTMSILCCIALKYYCICTDSLGGYGLLHCF